MKIGLIVPIGNLKKYGYQYNFEIILRNQVDFADEVVVVSSSRENSEKLFSKLKKIQFISTSKTWFETKKGHEIFSYEKLIENINLGLEILKRDGCQVAMQIHINQYIPQSSVKKLKSHFSTMIKEGKKYEWLYKKYQLGDLIFDADKKLPWILNLTTDNPYQYRPDAITNPGNKNLVQIESGNYKKYNRLALIDMMGEYTMKDAGDFYCFTHQENLKITGRAIKKKPSFNYEQWFGYHLNKINHKSLSRETLDKTGEEILSKRRSNFLSHEFQKKYSPYNDNLLAKTYRYVRNRIGRN